MALSPLVGCESEQGPKLELKTKATSAPDRLAPDEVLPGREQVFGIEVPKGMRVAARFGDVAHLTGRLEPEAVANHFRSRVLVQHVEVGANRTVFPRVHVKGDAEKRVYRIEIARHRNQTTVSIRDITPPPTTHGLSESERWQRAGRNPDGTLKNRLEQR